MTATSDEDRETLSDQADELRGMARGVFRGLHEQAALEAGAAALDAWAFRKGPQGPGVSSVERLVDALVTAPKDGGALLLRFVQAVERLSASHGSVASGTHRIAEAHFGSLALDKALNPLPGDEPGRQTKARPRVLLESWAVAGCDSGVWSLVGSDGNPRLFPSQAAASRECLSQQSVVRVQVVEVPFGVEGEKK